MNSPNQVTPGKRSLRNTNESSAVHIGMADMISAVFPAVVIETPRTKHSRYRNPVNIAKMKTCTFENSRLGTGRMRDSIQTSIPSAAVANFAARQRRLSFCKERAKSACIKKISTPDKSHGDTGIPVGDYEHPKRMGKITTEYMSKIMDFLGVNAKAYMDNFNYKPSVNNVQTGSPNISIPTKVGGKTVNTTIYGSTIKKPQAINPFSTQKKSA
jgi:hypothetical protein